MAKGAYVGVAGVARKVKSQYVGVAGVARKVKKAYAGVSGVARLCWEGIPTVSVPTQSGTLTYNGSTQSPTWSGYDSGIMTIGGTTSGVKAGTYPVTFTLKSGYQWADGTTGAKNVLWEIEKAEASCTVTPYSSIKKPISIAVGETITLNISCTGCTVTSATSLKSENLAVISFNSTQLVVKALSTGSSGGSGIMAAAIVVPDASVSYAVNLNLTSDDNHKFSTYLNKDNASTSLFGVYFTIE